MTYIDKITFNAIKRGPWFRDLPDHAIKALTLICSIKEYDVGEIIYGYGGERNYLYGILNGYVDVTISADGHQYFNLIQLHENSWFGESAFLMNQSKVFTITPLVKTSVLVLPAHEMKEIAEQFPIIYKNMYLDKLRTTQLYYDLISGLLTYPLKARMAMKLIPVLEMNGEFTEDGIVLNPCLNLKDWAKLAMGSMQRVTMVFDEWVEIGAIIHHQGGWLIPDIEIFKIEVNR